MGLIIKIYLGEYMSVNEISHELSVETINYVHDISTLKQLLLNGASINFQNKIGWSALFEAVTFGHAATLKELITMGVNINMIDSKGSETRKKENKKKKERTKKIEQKNQQKTKKKGNTDKQRK